MPPRRPQRANTGKETSKDKAAGLNRPDESFLSSSQESNLFETSGSDSESIVECEDTPFPMARHRRGRPAGDRMITKNSPKKIKRSIDSNGKLAYKKTTKSKYQKMTDFSLVDNRPHKLSEWQTCLLKTRKIKRRGSERSKNDFSRFLRPPIDITRVRSGLEIFDSKLNNFLTLSDSCIKKHVLESKNNHGSSLHGKNEELHWSLDCELPVVSLDWSCTGKFLFAAITNGEDCVIPEEVGENSSKLSNSMILIWRFINSPNDGLIRKIPISEKFGPAVSIACCPVREDLLIVVCALQTFFINILADENLHHPIDFPHDEGGRITCASWSLDGKYFSLGSSLGFLTLWAWEMNQSHPQIIASLRVTTRPLSSLCFDFQNRIAVGIFGTPAFIIDFFTASMIPKRTPMISSKSLFPVVNYSSLLNIWIIADTEFLCKGFYKISMESNMDYLLQDSSKNEPSVRQSTSFDDTLTKLVLNDNLEPVSADATSNIRRAPPKSPSNRNKKSDREIFEMEIEEKSVWGNCNVGTFTCQISAVGTSNMHSVIATGGCDGSVHLSWLQENVQKDERNFILQVEKNVLSVLPSTGGQSVINTHDPISTKEKNAVKLYPLINAVRSLAWCKSPDFPGILAISTGHKTVHLVSMDRSEFGSSKAGKREAIICALTADSSKRRRIADFETLCL